MNLSTATETLTFKLSDVMWSYEPDGGPLQGIGIRGTWYDPKEWNVDVRMTPRISPLPVGSLALVDDAVWRRSESGKWFALAGFGFLGVSMTDAQIRHRGKPLNAGEWPSS